MRALNAATDRVRGVLEHIDNGLIYVEPAPVRWIGQMLLAAVAIPLLSAPYVLLLFALTGLVWIGLSAFGILLTIADDLLRMLAR